MTLKEEIKSQLQKRYPGTHPNDFFTKWGAQPFNDDIDTNCYIIINDNQSITVALSTKTHPEDSAQEVRSHDH